MYASRTNTSQNSRNSWSHILSKAKVQPKTMFILSFQQNIPYEDLIKKKKRCPQMALNAKKWKWFETLSSSG